MEAQLVPGQQGGALGLRRGPGSQWGGSRVNSQSTRLLTANNYRSSGLAQPRVSDTGGYQRREHPFPYKRMTEAEIQRKKERGICFRCDAKFSPGHRCGNKKFQVILIEDEEEESPDNEEEKVETASDLQQSAIELPLSSVVGINGPKALKLRGKIEWKEVIVLIDSGASHNFIRRDVIEELGFPVTLTKPFGVGVGDGYRVRTQGECRDICLEIQGVAIVQNFFPFDMGGADVILGIAWLETLGKTTTDWRKHVMKFKMGEEKI